MDKEFWTVLVTALSAIVLVTVVMLFVYANPAVASAVTAVLLAIAAIIKAIRGKPDNRPLGPPPVDQAMLPPGAPTGPAPSDPAPPSAEQAVPQPEPPSAGAN